MIAFIDDHRAAYGVEPIAAHCDAWPPPWSSTIRTARCRTSGENRFDVFFVIAPPSQGVEPPANPARFTFLDVRTIVLNDTGSVKNLGQHACLPVSG